MRIAAGVSCAYCHRPLHPGERTGKTGDFEYHAERGRCCVLLLRDVELLQQRCCFLQDQLNRADLRLKGLERAEEKRKRKRAARPEAREESIPGSGQ